MAQTSNTSLRRLRKRVERALASGARGEDVVRDLESIVRDSSELSEDVLFAHRQLAELRLEEAPWQAALHLRQLIAADVRDDGVHALMGLCQALLGNFRAAIAAYKRAVQLAPRNPWYHHNLGHLIDVGLGDARQALHHLELAYEIEPREDEVASSLAHCLARVGELARARELVLRALKDAPGNREHHALLQWIEQGAPGSTPAGATQRPRVSPPVTLQAEMSPRSPVPGPRAATNKRSAAGRAARDEQATSVGQTSAPHVDAVLDLLSLHMPSAGFGPEHLLRARTLWGDFVAGRAPRIDRPDLYAAAVEYAIAQVECTRRVTQAGLARRYGVSAAAISGRYGEIRSALALVPGDPRYCVG